MAQQVSVGTDKYLLLAIPFFFLAAELMGTGGIITRMVRFATLVVGPVRGGLGHMNVLANMIMAGMSGSAVADAAGIGKLAIEIMRRGGYDLGFAAAITGGGLDHRPDHPAQHSDGDLRRHRRRLGRPPVPRRDRARDC